MTPPVGLVGLVIARIRGNDGPGEVEVVAAGLPQTWLAHAPVPVAVGTHVLVLRSRGPRAVDVEPWHLAGAGAVLAPGPTARPRES